MARPDSAVSLSSDSNESIPEADCGRKSLPNAVLEVWSCPGTGEGAENDEASMEPSTPKPSTLTGLRNVPGPSLVDHEVGMPSVAIGGGTPQTGQHRFRILMSYRPDLARTARVAYHLGAILSDSTSSSLKPPGTENLEA